MEKNAFFFLLVLICSNCSIVPFTGKKQFKTQSLSQVENNLRSFIEGHSWEHNGTEKGPVIAATPEELTRLKTAWASSGAEHEVLARRFAQADQAIKAGITFPPEGGQHNQWYQCDLCQRGLQTIDAHHHKCPNCGRIYSGFPYDNVLYTRQHNRNIGLAEDAAWAWAITGEKKYADFTASILSGYAERYLNYPMISASVSDKSVDVAAQKNGKYKSAGHLLSQTLDESTAMIPAAIAYDLIYDSKVLKSGDKKQIEDKFFRAMANNISLDKAGKSNHQTWANAALLYAGAVLGDKEMMKQAMLDDKNGFVAQMKISVMPEGMWYENSWAYHYYTLRALTYIAEGERRLGMDIYSYDLLRKMYLIAFDYRMADESLPRFGDAVNDSPNNQSVNEIAYAVYHDERLLSTLSTKPTWDMIALGRKEVQKVTSMQALSKVIPAAGHVILATDGPGKLTAALTFGPYGGSHGHYDKLSFVFFGFGQELGVDPGRAASLAYRLPIHKDWYKATTGHNAVLVDGIPQKEATGQLLTYAANTSYAAVSADAGPVFGNVDHRRFLLLGPTYLLIVDELRSKDGKEHTFDWLYHNKGQSVSCTLPAGNAKLGELPEGYTYIKDVAAFKVEKEHPFGITFTNEKILNNLTMLGQPGDEVFTGTGPISSVVERAPMVIVRRKGQLVRFITVLEPTEAQKQPDVRGVSLINGSSLAMNIARAGSEDYISLPGKNLENFSVSNKSGSSGQKVVLKSETKP
jgi:rubrerythrin